MTNTSYRDSHTAKDHGAHYDSVLFTPGTYDYEIWKIEQSVLEQILSRRFPNGIANYLDFACGTGRITSFLAPHAQHTVGVDISAEMLKEARAKIPEATFVLADITLDPAPVADAGPFDCVTSFRFFLNAEPELRDAALRALTPLMKPGSTLICNNHGNISSLWAVVLFFRRLLRKPPQRSLPYREMKALLESHGFRLKETHGICFLPRITSRMLPAALWTGIERLLGRIRALARFGIYQTYVAAKT